MPIESTVDARPALNDLITVCGTHLARPDLDSTNAQALQINLRQLTRVRDILQVVCDAAEYADAQVAKNATQLSSAPLVQRYREYFGQAELRWSARYAAVEAQRMQRFAAEQLKVISGEVMELTEHEHEVDKTLDAGSDSMA